MAVNEEQGTSETILDKVQERLSHFEPKQMGETEMSRLCDRAQIAAALGWNPMEDFAVFSVVMGVEPTVTSWCNNHRSEND